MVIRITKEVVQERIDALVYEFEVVEWSGTIKPSKIKCSICGEKINFIRGQSIYTKKMHMVDLMECVMVVIDLDIIRKILINIILRLKSIKN